MAAPDSEHTAVGEVVPLEPADVVRLHAAGNPRLQETDIESALASAPGASFWLPETGEFILVTPWRHRADLLSVHTLWSFRNDGALIQTAARRAASAGAASLVMLETGERRRPSFYHRHGFSRIEIIRTYEHTEPRVLARQYDSGAQRFERVTDDATALLRSVERLDHASFPWFWWNSASEFESYLRFPGVEVWAGFRDDRIVSYFGFTVFHGWAHLDRIAVAPDLQGVGLGRSTLRFAALRMDRQGAKRIGLSTQGSNRVSRRMYESMGFRHTRQSDYDVFGIVFDARRVHAPAAATFELDRGTR